MSSEKSFRSYLLLEQGFGLKNRFMRVSVGESFRSCLLFAKGFDLRNSVSVRDSSSVTSPSPPCFLLGVPRPIPLLRCHEDLRRTVCFSSDKSFPFEGKYSSATAAVSRSYCQQCHMYATSSPGSSSQSACICEGGYSGPSTGPCVACSAGEWCAGGVKGKCSANSYSPALSDGLEDCTCNAGYSPGTTEAPCAAW